MRHAWPDGVDMGRTLCGLVLSRPHAWPDGPAYTRCPNCARIEAEDLSALLRRTAEAERERIVAHITKRAAVGWDWAAREIARGDHLRDDATPWPTVQHAPSCTGCGESPCAYLRDDAKGG